MWKTIFLISEEDFLDTMMLKNEEKFGIAIQYRYICAFVSSQKENNNMLVIESFLSAIQFIRLLRKYYYYYHVNIHIVSYNKILTIESCLKCY